jgi:hypothetical protein
MTTEHQKFPMLLEAEQMVLLSSLLRVMDTEVLFRTMTYVLSKEQMVDLGERLIETGSAA